jgi:uncharacterized protein YgiM (DUF1202 family)
MKRIIDLLLLTLITVSLLLTACSLTNPAPATETQTQVSQPTQTAPATALPTNTPAPTATQLPTSTPLPTEANTPTQPSAATETPTPVATLANTPTTVPSGQTALVNQNTNCRSGPSADYDLIVTFLKGDSAKIVSRTSVDGYVLVEDPNNPGQSCWLWTQYVTISGDLSSLPVATAPPPLVNFTIDFTRIETCSSYILEFKVVNTGQKTIQAYTIVAKDTNAHTQQTTNSTTFNFINGCVIAQAIEYIDPGKAGYVYASNFTYDPKGNSFEATITICSHNDMTGACATQLVKFTP